VFTLPGVGTVVTGTLVAGTLSVGDAIAVQPQDLSTRARALQTHKEKVERAEPGMRVAVNLPGIEVGQIERGAVLCPPGTLAATPLFDVHLSVLPSAHRPLRHRERVRLHLGTGEVLARLLLLDGSEAAPGARDVAVQLLCETPAAPARGERFVVRTYSPPRAIGGGVVLDPAPARRYRRGDEAAQTLFEARGTEDAVAHVYAALAGRHADLRRPSWRRPPKPTRRRWARRWKRYRRRTAPCHCPTGAGCRTWPRPGCATRPGAC
jgi:selenocysteine-specific elongation factor